MLVLLNNEESTENVTGSRTDTKIMGQFFPYAVHYRHHMSRENSLKNCVQMSDERFKILLNSAQSNWQLAGHISSRATHNQAHEIIC
jgi:hypothetical protein